MGETRRKLKAVHKLKSAHNLKAVHKLKAAHKLKSAHKLPIKKTKRKVKRKGGGKSISTQKILDASRSWNFNADEYFDSLSEKYKKSSFKLCRDLIEINKQRDTTINQQELNNLRVLERILYKIAIEHNLTQNIVDCKAESF